MKIRVDKIPEEGKHIEANIESSEISLDLPGLSLSDPVTFAGRVTKSADDVHIEGTLQGTVRSECSRCLKAFKMSLDLDMNVIFLPEKDQTKKEGDTLEVDSNLSFYEGDVIDLTPEIKDLILISLPIKPVCRPDCKGLCPQCGADLNVSACECEQRKGASPFDKLKELRPKL